MDQCEQMGCCFDDTIKGKNIRFCYYKAGKVSAHIKDFCFASCGIPFPSEG